MKAPRKPKRAPGATQISISLPTSVLLAIDQLADDDNRTRSNWIVNELEKRIAAASAKKALDKAAPSFSSPAAPDPPRFGSSVNEDPSRSAPVDTTPKPRETRLRVALRAATKVKK